ncbi:MAG: hypothetical protein IT235_04145, partial [Bacteroidia bacterium]|nr:hypothetical protein [Bacteroidia bacterium]
MKPTKKISAFIAVLAFVGTMNAQNDDVYYTPSKEKVVSREESNKANQNYSQPNSQDDDYYRAPQSGKQQSYTTYTADTSHKSGNTYITNNYNYDDYYGYSYSARLRRFHRPIYSFGYYDPFYTNTYWYSNNPYQYGMSIYMGYNWWGPSYYSYSYMPYSYWGLGFGYGGAYMGFGYRPWGFYNPWYAGGYGFGYGNYMSGYYNGFYNGLSYGNYYYNSYDPNSYYGSR